MAPKRRGRFIRKWVCDTLLLLALLLLTRGYVFVRPSSGVSVQFIRIPRLTNGPVKHLNLT